ncbi:MAG: hypothetical protein ACXWWU_01980 [Candidatus Limnocylindria bacterium]
MKRLARPSWALGMAMLTACGSAVPQATVEPATSATASPEISSPSPALQSCVPEQIAGTYGRERTAADTDDSNLHGAWTLSIEPCNYLIAVDGIEQGGGRLELVDGDIDAGRLSLSEDLGCPNEFMGSGFYDFTFDVSTLSLEEAIAGTDLCEGRAAAVSGSPEWSR